MWRGLPASLWQRHHAGKHHIVRQFESFSGVPVSGRQLCGYFRQTDDGTTWSDPPSLCHSSATCLPPWQTSASVCVCACVFDWRNRERAHKSLGTDGGDRCRGQEVPCGPGGCGQVVTHLSLLAREALVTDTSAGPCVLICVIEPKSL